MATQTSALPGVNDDQDQDASPSAPAKAVLSRASLAAPPAPVPNPPAGTVSPDINPLPVGTMAGSAIKSGLQRFQTNNVNDVNSVLSGFSNHTDALAAPIRAGAGYVRDAYKAAVGNTPSPNAGQPIAAPQVPQLAVPSPAPLAWNTGSAKAPPAPPAPVPPPSLAGVTGSASTFVRQPAGAPNAAAQQPGGALVDQGVNVNGRHLNYGAMVNGVPTFSDGSGQPGSPGYIPRTMTNTDIQNLGANLQTAPAQRSALASDALGYTPSTDQQVSTLVRNMQQPGNVFGNTPGDYAKADAQDVASGDWRSAAGTVAHNLGVDATTGSPLQRRAALQRLGSLTSAVNNADTVDQDAAAKSQQLGQETQGQMGLENLRGQYGLQNTALEGQLARLRMPRQIQQLSDGSLASVDPISGAASPVTLPNGATAQGSKPERNSIFGTESGTNMFNGLTRQYLGADKDGMVADPTNPHGIGRAPTEAEVNAAQQKAYTRMQQLSSPQGVLQPPTRPTPTLDQFMPAARRANPGKSDADLQAFYKQQYRATQ